MADAADLKSIANNPVCFSFESILSLEEIGQRVKPMQKSLQTLGQFLARLLPDFMKNM